MLYYTGAEKNQATQNNQSKSLGGWISSSQVPNDFMNNLFGDLDYSSIKNDDKEYRVIAFKNISNTPIDLSLYTETPIDSFCKYQIGLILNSLTEDNCAYFEQLVNSKSAPYYVELKDCENIENKISLMQLPVNQYAGIFIKRILIEANNSDFKGKNKTCSEFEATLPNIDQEVIDYNYSNFSSIKDNSISIVLNF
jgi:hypothetical protein